MDDEMNDDEMNDDEMGDDDLGDDIGDDLGDDLDVGGDDDDVNLDFAVDDDDEVSSSDDEFDEDIEAKPKRTTARTRRKKEPTFGGIRRSRLTQPASAKKAWATMAETFEGEYIPYTIRVKLGANDAIDHVKFGRGFVIGIIDMSKAEVLFEEGIRKLVFGR